MKNLYLFNPENDMALASGSPYYMSPTSAKKMAADLAVLPGWYADTEGDVWVDVRQRKWMQEEAYFSLPVGWVTEMTPIYNKLYPWGWSPSLIHRLREKGLMEESLFSDDQMRDIRRLSGRGLSVGILPELRVPGTLGESFWLTTIEQIKGLSVMYGRMLLKAPWSGSGKGVRSVMGNPDESLSGWAKRIMASQGGIVGEPFYNKKIDFAMEFRTDGKEISFIGYSLFETDGRGAYKENRLASNDVIETYLTEYVSLGLLHTIRNNLQQILKDRLGDSYQGYLGVDMMICQEGEVYKLHPCVEINLRMNMGVVSRLFFDRYVFPSSQGRYVIEYYRKPGEALCFHEQMKQAYPLVKVAGKVEEGYMSLTPVFEDTSYQIYACIQKGEGIF